MAANKALLFPCFAGGQEDPRGTGDSKSERPAHSPALADGSLRPRDPGPAPSQRALHGAGRLVLRFPDSPGVGVEEPGSPGQRPVSRAPSGKRLPLHPLEPCLVSHRSPQMASLPPANHQPKSRTLDSSHPPSAPSRLSWQTWTQRGAWARSTIGKTCPPPSCIWRPSVWRGASRRSPSSPAAWWWSRGNLWPPTKGPTGALPWKAR